MTQEIPIHNGHSESVVFPPKIPGFKRCQYCGVYCVGRGLKTHISTIHKQKGDYEKEFLKDKEENLDGIRIRSKKRH